MPQHDLTRTLLTPDRLDVLCREARRCSSLPGDMAEVGSYRGGSVRAICLACPGKTLHLFDTFEGLPSDGGDHHRGEFACAFEAVKSYLAGCRVAFHPGLFPATAAGLESEKFCLVHLDGDLYETTRAGLEFFLPRMAEGGVIVLDDVHWRSCPGVDRALEEAGVMGRMEVTAPQQGVLRCASR